MGVQMGRGYRSALQSHLCLILVSVLLMGKVSLRNQEEMVQFHMRVSGGAGLEPVSRPQAMFLLTAMPQADGPHWDPVFLSTHCVCSCVVCTYLTWQPLQLHAPHLAAPTIYSSGSSPGLLLGISLDLMMSPGGRRQETVGREHSWTVLMFLMLVLCLSYSHPPPSHTSSTTVSGTPLSWGDILGF